MLGKTELTIFWKIELAPFLL